MDEKCEKNIIKVSKIWTWIPEKFDFSQSDINEKQFLDSFSHFIQVYSFQSFIIRFVIPQRMSATGIWILWAKSLLVELMY